MKRIDTSFFYRDVLEVAPDLLGQVIVRQMENGEVNRFVITETEAYRGEEDLACHASKGRTRRTEIMYAAGGYVYVYLIYGMYWLLNFVTGQANQPQAVLIRGVEGCNGPGKLGRLLQLDKTFYGENLNASERLYLVQGSRHLPMLCSPRINVDYAGPYWSSKPWRFMLKNI